MQNWLDRYNSGECAAVWWEMDGMGESIRDPKYLSEAQEVANATMKRALKNIETLIELLPSIGYRFASPPGSMTWATELRLLNAFAYAKAAGRKYAKNPWSHPALAWVEIKQPPLSETYLEGRPAWSVHRKPFPGVFGKLEELEIAIGGPLSLSMRAFWEIAGSVDLAGSHPFLNPLGSIATLRVPFARAGEVNIDPTAGARFVAQLRRAFHWSGFPGWEGHPDPPQREIEYLQAKLAAL